MLNHSTLIPRTITLKPLFMLVIKELIMKIVVEIGKFSSKHSQIVSLKPDNTTYKTQFSRESRSNSKTLSW